MELKGKVAIVTGGASGLGEATVRNIVAQGGKALIMDLNMDRGKAIVAESSQRGFRKSHQRIWSSTYLCQLCRNWVGYQNRWKEWTTSFRCFQKGHFYQFDWLV